MTAVDTNILVYAPRLDSPWNRRAAKCLRQLAEGNHPWAIPWPCIHEFLAIVTHPRVYRPPTPMPDAIRDVDAWMESPTLRLLAEQDLHWPTLQAALLKGDVIGPMVHDARIAALCHAHGVTRLYSGDRDFSRFPSLNVVNPLIDT